MNTKNKWLKYSLVITTITNINLIQTASADVEFDCNTSVWFCPAPASGGSGGSAKNTENIVYSGFIWELFGEQGMIPQFIIGVRSLEVKDNDNVNGADASIRIKYQDKLGIDSLRLAYVGGERDVMGNVGVGYSFTHNSWLGTAALQGPYVRVSTDYVLADNKFRYFAEINTLDKPNKVTTQPSNSGGCGSYNQPTYEFYGGPSAYQLVNVVNGQLEGINFGGPVNADPSTVVNGKTCFAAID
jgi:hypothetical protein